MAATLTWLGQAGFILDTGKATIAVDPFCGTAKGNSERIYPNDIEKGAYQCPILSKIGGTHSQP